MFCYFCGKYVEIIGSKAPGSYLDQLWSNKILVLLCEGPRPPNSMISGFWTHNAAPRGTRPLQFWRINKISNLLICRIIGNVTDPGNPYFWLRLCRITSNNTRKSKGVFKHTILGNLRISKNEKGACREILELRLIHSWKSWIRDNVFKETWNWHFVFLNSTEGT